MKNMFCVKYKLVPYGNKTEIMLTLSQQIHHLPRFFHQISKEYTVYRQVLTIQKLIKLTGNHDSDKTRQGYITFNLKFNFYQ